MDGYVFLWRKALENDVLRHPVRFSLFVRLITRAATRDVSLIYRGKHLDLKRGQVAMSLSGMAAECGATIKEIRTALKHLKMATMLDTDAGTGVVVVTLSNYDKYQPSRPDKGTETDTEPGKQGARLGHGRGTHEQESKTVLDSSSPNGDARARLWAEMKGFFGGSNPGALIGRWCRDFGEGTVIETYFTARRQDTLADPRSWMTAALQKRRPGLSHEADRSELPM